MISNHLATAIFSLFGLLIGSFLNVVILRLPVILQRQWQKESQAFLQEQNQQHIEQPISANASEEPFNLAVPRSRCGNCNHLITALENIPVISYLCLRGRCLVCKKPIGIRYPLVEITTAALFAFCGYQYGLNWTGVAWAVFCAFLITLICIDWDTTLLPDNLTLPLLWAGLLASSVEVIATPLSSSVLGASVGYLSLWSVYWGFKLITNKEGMGHGDFKLLAALGAWLGISSLLPILIASSLIGAVVGITLKLRQSLRVGGYLPYGPFLGGAGLMVLLIGHHTVQHWLVLLSL